MPTNIALGVKGGGGNTKMRRTEIVSDDSTLFQIFCPRLWVLRRRGLVKNFGFKVQSEFPDQILGLQCNQSFQWWSR